MALVVMAQPACGCGERNGFWPHPVTASTAKTSAHAQCAWDGMTIFSLSMRDNTLYTSTAYRQVGGS